MNPQVALITGGASGMGKTFSLRMAQQGIKVAIIDMNDTQLAELSSQSENISCYSCDVTDHKKLLSTVQEIDANLGPVDRLVTCAAIMPTSKLAEQSTKEIHKIMAINYGGTVNVIQAVLPKMLARNTGQIVIFSSTGGSVFVPECGAYCASKAATSAYAEMLMEENRNSKVHFMLVCPPLVDTPLLAQATNTSNPKIIQASIKNKRFVSADFIIDKVEKGLSKGTRVLLPGTDAKLITCLRRFSPSLVWKIIHSSNR